MAAPPSKLELLTWIRTKYDSRLKGVEDCRTGTVYVHILNHLYGSGWVPIHMVNFDAKTPREYMGNMKVAFRVLGKKKVQHRFKMEKLVEGSYAENLQFLQFLKAIHDGMKRRKRYNAAKVEEKSTKKKGGGLKKKHSKTKLRKSPSNVSNASNSSVSSTSVSRSVSRSASNSSLKKKRRPATARRANKKDSAIRELIGGLSETLLGMESERNGYFTKLRAIELLVETKDWSDGDEMREKIERLLYTRPDLIDIETGEVYPETKNALDESVSLSSSNGDADHWSDSQDAAGDDLYTTF